MIGVYLRRSRDQSLGRRRGVVSGNGVVDKETLADRVVATSQAKPQYQGLERIVGSDCRPERLVAAGGGMWGDWERCYFDLPVRPAERTG